MKKIRTTKAIITIATIILSSFSNLLADRLIVGIIEQNFNNWDIDTINPFDIRVAFEKKNNEWKSFPTDFQPPNNCLPYYPNPNKSEQNKPQKHGITEKIFLDS